MIRHISDTAQIVNRFRGRLLSLAVGAAVGTTAEFRPRGSFPEITDLCGGVPFSLNPGEWTDDTSMAVCFAKSFIEGSEVQMLGADYNGSVPSLRIAR